MGRCWPLEAGPQTRDGGAQAPEMFCGSCKCPGDVWHGYQKMVPSEQVKEGTNITCWRQESSNRPAHTGRDCGLVDREYSRLYPEITPEKEMGWEMFSPTLSPALISNTLSGRITSLGARGQHQTVWQRRSQAPMDTSVTQKASNRTRT